MWFAHLYEVVKSLIYDSLPGFKFNSRKLTKCLLNLKNASRKIKHSNLFASPNFQPLYVGQTESRRQEIRRYCLCT